MSGCEAKAGQSAYILQKFIQKIKILVVFSLFFAFFAIFFFIESL
jgi:hypothetical protein